MENILEQFDFEALRQSLVTLAFGQKMFVSPPSVKKLETHAMHTMELLSLSQDATDTVAYEGFWGFKWTWPDGVVEYMLSYPLQYGTNDETE